MFLVYVIRNSSGKIYIGQTSDIQRRMLRHNGLLPTKKKSFTHKQGGTWKVVYSESFSTRSEAMRRERELKNASGREYIKKVLPP